MSVDLVTVFHRAENKLLAEELADALERFETVDHTLWMVDNTEVNRGFAAGCNLGASWGDEAIVGFLNPDLQVHGAFLRTVLDVFDSDPGIVITGERFDKPARELQAWGCGDWVCGACLFVRRDWFESVGGFDERFVWAWEETDLIRTAQIAGLRVRSVRLPVRHESPTDDRPEDVEDVAYKTKHFEEGAKLFRQKWRMR